MEPTQPYMYVPPSHATPEGPRYFRPRAFIHRSPQLVIVIEGTLSGYERKSGAGAGKEPEARAPHPTNEQRAVAKGDIQKLLHRVIDAAPLDPLEREPLHDLWLELRDARDKSTATACLTRLEQALKVQCRELVPDTIKGESKAITGTIAGSRDKNIGNQLRHMCEVHDAGLDEAKRGHREIDHNTTPSLIKLEREMGMVLSMARLDEEISAERKAYDRDESGLLNKDRGARFGQAVAREIGLFEAHMDRIHNGWRGEKLKIPEDWPLKGDANKMTLQGMVDGLKGAKKMETFKPYAELLHHVVAKRAYKFKGDLTKAYSEDNAHMNALVQKRNKKRDELRAGENPFDSHQELLSAAYNAKWAATARRIIKLMDRFEGTMEDPAIVPVEATPLVKVGDRSLFGRAADKGVGRAN